MPTSRMPRSHHVQIAELAPELLELRGEVVTGLEQTPKTLPCRLLYDQTGAELFERICSLPEYYPTRTEIGILRDNMGGIHEAIGPSARIVEFGSGSAVKTRLLLDGLGASEYVPIDIARAQLQTAAEDIARAYPSLHVLPVCADYTKALSLPPARADVERTVIFFPGSTIGNFEPLAAQRFLAAAARTAGPGGGLLIGVDLEKDVARLEPAYNDARGVTAEFNLNILTRLNRELGCDFDTANFQHRAIYNTEKHRIEMHLVSNRDQTVTIPATANKPSRTIHFSAGESIVTEHSYKYSIQSFSMIGQAAGWKIGRVWTDADQLFALFWFVKN